MGKGGRCVRLTTLPPSCVVVMKFGNLNFLKPSVPLQACNGTAIPFTGSRRDFESYPGNLFEVLRKTTISHSKYIHIPMDIWTGHVKNLN